MDVYKETVEKLRKLRLNETQMSQEQFVRYEKKIKKYMKKTNLLNENVDLDYMKLKFFFTEES